MALMKQKLRVSGTRIQWVDHWDFCGSTEPAAWRPTGFSRSGKQRDEPLVNVTGQPAPAWNVTEWLQLAEGSAPDRKLDVHDLSGTIVCLLFVQGGCMASRTHALPSLTRLAAHYAEDPLLQLIVLNTPLRKPSRNSARDLRNLVEEITATVAVGSFDNELPPPVVDEYSIRRTPWWVLIDQFKDHPPNDAE